jgi:pyruvate, water dikinase
MIAKTCDETRALTQFLVEQGINSISFNPDAILKGIENIKKAEIKLSVDA